MTTPTVTTQFVPGQRVVVATECGDEQATVKSMSTIGGRVTVEFDDRVICSFGQHLVTAV